MLAIGDRYSATAFPPVDALPVLARQGQDLTILLLMRVGTEDLGVLALCGFADHNFSFDTESLWVQAGLMAATLKRDAQARQLAQARDAAEAANAALAEARDAAEAANRAKSAFLAQMSHELRTPLNGVLGYADILMRKRLDDDTTNGLMIIKQSGEHLLTLINDILDLSKIEAGRLALSPTPLQLPVFLDGIVGIIRARAEAKQLHLHVAVSPDLPLWVTADETRLRQVLLNLLGNAVKFTEQGSVTLRVSSVGETQYLASLPVLSSELTCATGETQNLCRLRFEVSDTGPGIAPEQLEAIFQPFEQVGELRRRAEGTGLGLAISRQLVRAMGGEVHVESALGQGSTFWFALALPVADAVLPAAAEPERMITGYTGRRRTLLVVDDIASNRQVLAAMLEPLGFRVLLAEDGLQAVTLAQQQPDLILMDRWMPVLSGLEAARQIRQLPDMPRIPIVATSASVSEADQTVIRAAGYDDFLPKPIAWPRLVALLAQHLQLEWVYATDSEAARDGGVTATPGVLEPPPADELAALFELVQIGDIRAVQARAAQLQQSDVRWRPFMHRVVQLAGQFDLEQILALLAQYLPEDRQA
jgi:signal transduction histidine kinase/CheY-like chemotaxis protein